MSAHATRAVCSGWSTAMPGTWTPIKSPCRSICEGRPGEKIRSLMPSPASSMARIIAGASFDEPSAAAPKSARSSSRTTLFVSGGAAVSVAGVMLWSLSNDPGFDAFSALQPAGGLFSGLAIFERADAHSVERRGRTLAADEIPGITLVDEPRDDAIGFVAFADRRNLHGEAVPRRVDALDRPLDRSCRRARFRRCRCGFRRGRRSNR